MEHQYNSPWNIAAKFSVNMDFTADQIADMLQEYENDCHTGMNIDETAKYICDYTSGYPYLAYMSIRVGVGKSDFDDLRKSGSYYVDKTNYYYTNKKVLTNQSSFYMMILFYQRNSKQCVALHIHDSICQIFLRRK